MVNLIARSLCEGLLPISIGLIELTEVIIEKAYSVAPFQGQEKAVSDVLIKTTGVGFPEPNRALSNGGARSVWVGGGRALIIGVDLPDLTDMAAVTDQSDGIAAITIVGTEAEAVLARLVPLDLRENTFKNGTTARTYVNQMPASVTRLNSKSFEVMTIRSMARTLVQEMTEAATRCATRASHVDI